MNMMNNSNLTSLSSLEAGEECYGTCNETAVLTSNSSDHNVPEYTTYYIRWIIIFLICCFGLVGNGNVIWLLGFCMKRNPFTTYVLNLAVADFGVLLYLLIISTIFIAEAFMNVSPNLFISLTWMFFYLFFFFLYSISQILLAVISIDRCVSVLFPIWHRCHRPTHLSTTVCALIWGISALLIGIHVILLLTIPSYMFSAIDILCIATAFLCLPVMAISALILFIKVCFKSQKNDRRRLLITILLSLLFYLIFAFPLSIAHFIISFVTEHMMHKLFYYSYIGAPLNSSVNPLIYFLVGRKKKSQSRENMKAILQRVFKEEEEKMESAV